MRLLLEPIFSDTGLSSLARGVRRPTLSTSEELAWNIEECSTVSVFGPGELCVPG